MTPSSRAAVSQSEAAEMREWIYRCVILSCVALMVYFSRRAWEDVVTQQGEHANQLQDLSGLVIKTDQRIAWLERLVEMNTKSIDKLDSRMNGGTDRK